MWVILCLHGEQFYEGGEESLLVQEVGVPVAPVPVFLLGPALPVHAYNKVRTGLERERCSLPVHAYNKVRTGLDREGCSQNKFGYFFIVFICL